MAIFGRRFPPVIVPAVVVSYRRRDEFVDIGAVEAGALQSAWSGGAGCAERNRAARFGCQPSW